MKQKCLFKENCVSTHIFELPCWVLEYPLGQALCTCRNYITHLEQKSMERIGDRDGGGWGDVRGAHAGIRSEDGRRNTCSEVVGFCRAFGNKNKT